MIRPIIFKEKTDTLIIKDKELKQLEKKPKQILWIRDGLYGMIPIERVKNALENRNAANLLADLEVKNYISQPHVIFQWNETVEIPASTGQSMEKYNGDNTK